MDSARTRGQPAALAAVAALLRTGVPHAILLVGPAGVGKTTLALDLAAALLCQGPDTRARPCRVCRACRMVDSLNHPDLHRLAPTGPGAQIGIGGSERAHGVRDLIGELALMPVEGGARVAIIEEAHRLNEDAQSALLKTLEEPPEGVVILLCAEEEERLLPTVRSRCARVRLGPVAPRAIEELLAEQGLAEPPLAGRLARIAAGRPGVAVAYAHSPGAEALRTEVTHRLLDLSRQRAAAGLPAIRDLMGRAGELARALQPAGSMPLGAAPIASGRVRRRAKGSEASADQTQAAPTASGGLGDDADDLSEPDSPAAGGGRATAAERRRAAHTLIKIWQELVRDIALVEIGERRRLRDPGLLEELETARAELGGSPGSTPAAFLARLARAAELLDGNVTPELVLDDLVLAWQALGAGSASRATGRART